MKIFKKSKLGSLIIGCISVALFASILGVGIGASSCGDVHQHECQYDSQIDATCTEDGLITYKCECGSTKTEEIKAQHKYDYTIVKQATCTEEGSQMAKCSVCGYEEIQAIKALGHQYENNVTKEATCTEDGCQVATCSVCGHEETQVIEALGHTLKVQDAKAAGCTEDGYAHKVCATCGYETTEIIAAQGHNYSSKVTQKATCTTAGVKEYTCKTCGDVKTESIAPSHNYGIYDTCTACGADKYHIDITLVNTLPQELSYRLNWSEGSDHYYSKSKINSIVCKNSKTSIFKNNNLYVTFNGVKTYDEDGEYGTNFVKFRYILKDEDGNIICTDAVVIYDDTLVNQSFSKTVAVYDDITSLDLSKKYTLELIDEVI